MINGIYVGFVSHSDYRNLCIGDSSVADECEYFTSSRAPVFVVSNDDEYIKVRYEGVSLEDIVDQVNKEDWGNEEPNAFTVDSFLEWVKNTCHDCDSSEGYCVIQNGKPIAWANDTNDIMMMDNGV